MTAHCFVDTVIDDPEKKNRLIKTDCAPKLKNTFIKYFGIALVICIGYYV